MCVSGFLNIALPDVVGYLIQCQAPTVHSNTRTAEPSFFLFTTLETSNPRVQVREISVPAKKASSRPAPLKSQKKKLYVWSARFGIGGLLSPVRDFDGVEKRLSSFLFL